MIFKDDEHCALVHAYRGDYKVGTITKAIEGWLFYPEQDEQAGVALGAPYFTNQFAPAAPVAARQHCGIAAMTITRNQ